MRSIARCCSGCAHLGRLIWRGLFLDSTDDELEVATPSDSEPAYAIECTLAPAFMGIDSLLPRVQRPPGVPGMAATTEQLTVAKAFAGAEALTPPQKRRPSRH